MNNAELFGYHVKRAMHMLTCAAAKGADILVLGAFGCGAFQNDPEVVARAYKTVLQEFPKVFKQIEFAIYRPASGSRNYDVFSKTLGCKVKTGYPVVTICGSTRFKDAFIEAQKRLTLEGKIVISVGLFGHSGDEEVWEGMDEGTLSKTKMMLDDMHKRKIDMADEIYVINVGGYIGESTRSEIEYAKAHGKEVHYLEE